MGRRGALAAVLALLAIVTVTSAPSQGDVIQRGGVRVGFDAQLQPRELPRAGTAPVSVSIDGRIVPVGGGLPRRLNKIEVGINGHGRLDPSALPVCPLAQIQPATTKAALAACRRSLVGEGRFSAEVALPGQTPFPSRGRVVAFNGRYRGAPAILAHVYGFKPAPTSFTLPFRIAAAEGTFATVLTAVMPRVSANHAYVTGISMTLGGSDIAGGAYARAGCPAPDGLPTANFKLARASFAFAGGTTVRSTVVRACRARR